MLLDWLSEQLVSLCIWIFFSRILCIEFGICINVERYYVCVSKILLNFLSVMRCWITTSVMLSRKAYLSWNIPCTVPNTSWYIPTVPALSPTAYFVLFCFDLFKSCSWKILQNTTKFAFGLGRATQVHPSLSPMSVKKIPSLENRDTCTRIWNWIKGEKLKLSNLLIRSTSN